MFFCGFLIFLDVIVIVLNFKKVKKIRVVLFSILEKLKGMNGC